MVLLPYSYRCSNCGKLRRSTISVFQMSKLQRDAQAPPLQVFRAPRDRLWDSLGTGASSSASCPIRSLASGFCSGSRSAKHKATFRHWMGNIVEHLPLAKGRHHSSWDCNSRKNQRIRTGRTSKPDDNSGPVGGSRGLDRDCRPETGTGAGSRN